jgi:uncharacterized protein YjiS (DUF1127 family)
VTAGRAHPSTPLEEIPVTTHADVMASRLAASAAQRRLSDHVAALVRATVEAWRERRRLAATRTELEQLDAATLRDLGMHRSEVGSVAAELHGFAVASRRQSLASRLDLRR